MTALHNKGTLVGTTRAVYFIASDNKIKQIGEGASAIVVTNEGEIFAGSNDGIRHSNDDGAHWAKLGPEVLVYALVVVDEGAF